MITSACLFLGDGLTGATDYFAQPAPGTSWVVRRVSLTNRNATAATMTLSVLHADTGDQYQLARAASNQNVSVTFADWFVLNDAMSVVVRGTQTDWEVAGFGYLLEGSITDVPVEVQV